MEIIYPIIGLEQSWIQAFGRKRCFLLMPAASGMLLTNGIWPSMMVRNLG
jgi:hypothetical protein